jgi:predicted nuclease of predicted toxin-antitoxin system
MNLYLDDDAASALLARLLRNARHDVQVPADVGLAGRSDAVHLAHAIREGRVCLSRNYRDFEELHLLVLQAQGHHPGILLVRRDNDPKRNLSARDIVRAVRNLEAANVPLADQCYVLNPWQ